MFLPVSFTGNGYEGCFPEPLSVMTKEAIQQFECIREGVKCLHFSDFEEASKCT